MLKKATNSFQVEIHLLFPARYGDTSLCSPEQPRGSYELHLRISGKHEYQRRRNGKLF